MTERLNRAFFEEELDALAAAYTKDAGVRKVVTILLLRNGVNLQVERKPVCTDTYLTVDYKTGTQLCRAVIPYASIIGVEFTPDSSGTVGFHR